MDRRDLLARFGAVLGTAAIGGCLGRYREVTGDVGETTTDGTTIEQTTRGGNQSSGGGAPTLTSKSFRITDAGCGNQTSEAEVEFREDDGTVAVSGTIPGSNTCYTAELSGAEYDPAADALTVTVAATERSGADACAQCIVEIDYEATVGFDGGLPATVRVVHETMGESATVATADAA